VHSHIDLALSELFAGWSNKLLLVQTYTTSIVCRYVLEYRAKTKRHQALVVLFILVLFLGIMNETRLKGKRRLSGKCSCLSKNGYNIYTVVNAVVS
jgi:hypothetical protein